MTKVCAACHEDLPKDSYSKKQWKLDECQRRCKVCTANNREVQQQPQKHDDEESNTGDITKTLDSMYLENVGKISDEELFQQPTPQYGDCPICFIRIPSLHAGSRHQTCCGKLICCGCFYAPVYDNQGNEVDNQKCPFCRTPHPETNEEMIKRYKTRLKLDDPIAIYNTGNYYRDGRNGFTKDYTKALELWHRAAELGSAEAYCNIGVAYEHGIGVEVDMKKAEHYFELAAMGGDLCARHNLGIYEENAGNIIRSIKHHMIAVRGGCPDSLNKIKQLYTIGQASKDDYTKALQSYQVYLAEIKSDQRDEAAAADEDCRYY